MLKYIEILNTHAIILPMKLFGLLFALLCLAGTNPASAQSNCKPLLGTSCNSTFGDKKTAKNIKSPDNSKTKRPVAKTKSTTYPAISAAEASMKGARPLSDLDQGSALVLNSYDGQGIPVPARFQGESSSRFIIGESMWQPTPVIYQDSGNMYRRINDAIETIYGTLEMNKNGESIGLVDDPLSTNANDGIKVHVYPKLHLNELYGNDQDSLLQKLAACIQTTSAFYSHPQLQMASVFKSYKSFYDYPSNPIRNFDCDYLARLVEWKTNIIAAEAKVLSARVYNQSKELKEFGSRLKGIIFPLLYAQNQSGQKIEKIAPYYRAHCGVYLKTKLSATDYVITRSISLRVDTPFVKDGWTVFPVQDNTIEFIQCKNVDTVNKLYHLFETSIAAAKLKANRVNVMK